MHWRTPCVAFGIEAGAIHPFAFMLTNAVLFKERMLGIALMSGILFVFGVFCGIFH